jgi:hypothetical protein
MDPISIDTLSEWRCVDLGGVFSFDIMEDAEQIHDLPLYSRYQ